MERKIKVAVFVVVAVLVCAALAFDNKNTSSAPPLFVEEEPAKEADDVYIDLKGEVLKPGVYRVDEGTRLFQVIAMAGGVTGEADLARINQSKVVLDGREYVVPGFEEDVSDDEGLININTADLEALSSLPNIGEATAQSIIDYRQKNGFFTEIEEITKVSGIGEATLEKIAEFITV